MVARLDLNGREHKSAKRCFSDAQGPSKLKGPAPTLNQKDTRSSYKWPQRLESQDWQPCQSRPRQVCLASGSNLAWKSRLAALLVSPSEALLCLGIRFGMKVKTGSLAGLALGCLGWPRAPILLGSRIWQPLRSHPRRSRFGLGVGFRLEAKTGSLVRLRL